MPRISETRRRERRAEITDAALRCFIRIGYHHTSMADIIAESGLSAGAIYSYFPGKTELLRAVAAELIADRRDEILAASAARVLTPAELATILVEGVRRHAPENVLVQVWAEATVDESLRTMMQETLGGIREVVAEALARWAAAHPDDTHGIAPDEWGVLAAPIVMGLIPGFTLQRAVLDGFDEQTFLRAISAVLPG